MTTVQLMNIAKTNMSNRNYGLLELMMSTDTIACKRQLRATIHNNKQDTWGHNKQGVMSIDRQLIAYINGVG
jgi:hypothetical protein